jgi:predicted dehydrogenase
MNSTSPIVDCGVHYVDIMCQMTKSKPKYVNAVGARLSDEIDNAMYNYGHLQVVFEDGSIGWYESGWGPMISETAFFVKDVFGPKGSVSIAEPKNSDEITSSDIDSHTKTNQLLVHFQDRDSEGNFSKKDEYISTSDEPDHDQLCKLEQEFLLEAIKKDLDLSQGLEDVINSMKIVLAADKSVRTGKQISIDSIQ